MRSSSGRNSTSVGALRDDDEARHVVGHLDPGEALHLVVGVAHQHGEVERQAGDVGERVRRVDGQRGEHREDLGLGSTRPSRPRSSSSRASQRRMWMPSRLERRRDVVAEAAGVPVDELADALGQRGEHVARRQAVGGGDLQAHVGPPLQPGDAHHVELVEVAGEDREELQPLQQRLRRVLGQGEHARVERQPGQLAVAEPVVGQVVDVRGAVPRRDRSSGTRVGARRVRRHRVSALMRSAHRGRTSAARSSRSSCRRQVERAVTPVPRRAARPRCVGGPDARARARARQVVGGVDVVPQARRQPRAAPRPRACRAADPAPNAGRSATPGPRGEQRRAGAGGVGHEGARCGRRPSRARRPARPGAGPAGRRPARRRRPRASGRRRARRPRRGPRSGPAPLDEHLARRLPPGVRPVDDDEHPAPRRPRAAAAARVGADRLDQAAMRGEVGRWRAAGGTSPRAAPWPE